MEQRKPFDRAWRILGKCDDGSVGSGCPNIWTLHSGIFAKTVHILYGFGMTTRFEQIANLAADQHGVVTTADVSEAGIDSAALRALARTGAVVRLSAGLYRVPLIDATRLTPFMEAVLWTRRSGVLSHTSALTVRGFGDFSESHVDLTVPPQLRLRKSGPNYYRLWHENLTPDEIEAYEGIPVTTVLRSIKDANAAGADPQQLRLATRQAFQAGELTPAQYRAARRLFQSSVDTRNAS